MQLTLPTVYKLTLYVVPTKPPAWLAYLSFMLFAGSPHTSVQITHRLSPGGTLHATVWVDGDPGLAQCGSHVYNVSSMVRTTL